MSSSTLPPRPEAFEAFLDLSARIGKDCHRTQGAGGNTSIKNEKVMWVKGSGTWLANATERAIMVPVAIDPLVEALRSGDPRAEKATDFVVEDSTSSALRPSIETSLHAVLPQRLVAHFHDVDAIALSVLARREESIAERMSKIPNLSWRLIPYRRPGTPLAAAIDAVADTRPDVLVLCNHGLIVCAETVEELDSRIRRVGEAFELEARAVKAPEMNALTTLARGTNYRPARKPEWHATALCQTGRALALGGSLYPDHVIFLGTELGCLRNDKPIASLLADFDVRKTPPPKVILVEGKGVLTARELTGGGEAMVGCLADVVTRIPENEEVVYLTAEDEYQLTNWEAEHYRQSLDREAARQ